MKPSPADEAAPRAGAFDSTLTPEGSALRPRPAGLGRDRTFTMDADDVVPPGEIEGAPPLPGRYEDLGLIGAGSFGEVRRVRDTLLDRVVAMKLVRAEHAAHDELRRRFLIEAKITAQLQHPGIVALYDRGELDDGRLWYTMKEVRGRTLREVIRELHQASGPEGFGVTPSGWTFRRLVDAFARIAQALAYAHKNGVVHRDLKPANLMVGELGEVLVMDWGLACHVRARSEPAGAIVVPSHESGMSSERLTQLGQVLGTPAYMPPEQAEGRRDQHGPESDVYALGAILYHLLSGRPPYEGSAESVLAQVLTRAPRPVIEAAAGGPGVPAELAAICARAMMRSIGARYPDASEMAEDVLAFLDGARRREQALSALAEARAIEPEIAALRARAAEAEASARALGAALRSHDPPEKKRPAWAREDEAARLGRAAALAEVRWMQAAHGALSIDPDLPEAHALLADCYASRLLDAEAAHRDDEAERAELLLRAHDRGRHAVLLRGEGALTLITDPPGAEVLIERFEPEDRRLVPVFVRAIGPTPIVALPLPRGSYLLRIRAAGREEVRYPVVIERGGHWDGRAPGETTPHPILLPAAGEIGPGEIYVPAGPCWVGGDPAAGDSLPRRRVWIDAFVIGRFPVTTVEYLAFLNDLVVQGRDAEALAACPRLQLGLAEGRDEPALLRDDRGIFLLPPDRKGLSFRPDTPMVLVDWHASMAYARWVAARENKPFRLLNDLEREKAARGVDGRLMPWGDHLEPTLACVAESNPTEPARESVTSHPFDEGPYGARGLAGNVRDWCINLWKHDGPPVVEGRLAIDPAPADDPGFRVVRGGAWPSSISYSRAAGRFACRPDDRRPVVGLRLGRSIVR
ncbi:MAG: bifunctional serine/threonine-protein kinase/formylglycine-generating enzyme family protein [Byssovorax sp.]